MGTVVSAYSGPRPLSCVILRSARATINTLTIHFDYLDESCPQGRERGQHTLKVDRTDLCCALSTLHNTTRHNTTLHSTTLHNTTLHSTLVHGLSAATLNHTACIPLFHLISVCTAPQQDTFQTGYMREQQGKCVCVCVCVCVCGCVNHSESSLPYCYSLI